MSYLTLKIKQADEWTTAVIPSSSSISVEQISTIFDLDAGGGFSYPFTLPVEANQHLFPTMTNNHGAHIYDLIYHKPFRLFVGGVPLLHGVIDMDDEVDIETQDDGTHTVAINLASDNQELSALLDGVNCQDVPVKDRIPVGTEFRSMKVTFYDGNKFSLEDRLNYSDAMPHASYNVPLPPHVFSLNKYKASIDGSGEWENPTNVSEPYPKPYCNARVGIQAREKQKDGTYKTLREYELFDADRPNTGICFYVLYFLDCLFENLGISYNNQALLGFEDMKRLAFFNTKCECDGVPTAKDYNGEEMRRLFEDINFKWQIASVYTGAAVFKVASNAYTKYANSKNFPDTEAKNILQDIQNAFGIRFLFDSEMRHCKAVFIKDIFSNCNPVVSHAIIHAEQQTDYHIKGVKMTFGIDDEENTSYNFKNENSPVIVRNGFSSIEVEKGIYDMRTYYDTVTGNMYRIEVDEDATKEEELDPSMIEIKQFGDAWTGDITKEDFVRTIDVAFSPIIVNRVENIEVIEKTDEDGSKTSVSRGSGTTGQRSSAGNDNSSGTTRGNRGEEDSSSKEFIPFVFIDQEISDAETAKIYNDIGFLTAYDSNGNTTQYYHQKGTWVVQYTARYGFSSQYLENQKKYAESRSTVSLKYNTVSKPIVRYEEDPLSVYDAGYTLGVMRGPGNSSGTEIVQEDYDGNGNARWAYVPTSYAFTSDSIDEYGRPYDYNGTAEGGIDITGRMSLKLWAEKVSLYQGLAIDGTSVTVTTAKDAAYWLAVLFPESNMDILAMHPKTKQEVEAKGWSSENNIEGIVYCLPKLVNGTYAGLYNAIQADGEILTPAEFSKYINNLTSRGESKGIRIKENATTEDYENLVGLVNLYYAPDAAPPYTIKNVPESALTEFYPINSVNSHRGLFHKFNYEYAWFLIHSRLVELIVTMSLAELSSIDLSKWYTFGQYTGLIKQLSYSIDNEKGLSEVTVQLYYI